MTKQWMACTVCAVTFAAIGGCGGGDGGDGGRGGAAGGSAQGGAAGGGQSGDAASADSGAAGSAQGGAAGAAQSGSGTVARGGAGGSAEGGAAGVDQSSIASVSQGGFAGSTGSAGEGGTAGDEPGGMGGRAGAGPRGGVVGVAAGGSAAAGGGVAGVGGQGEVAATSGAAGDGGASAGADGGASAGADGSAGLGGQPGARQTVLSVVAGSDHTCAMLDNGSVKCWGINRSGALGLGDISDRGDEPCEMGDALPPADLGTGRSAVALAAGGGYTCALLDDGALKCWGTNSSGRLGLGDTSNRGDGPGEMGDALPGVDLGTGRTAVALAAGMLHACALLDNGSVKCWGNNINGALGLGDTANRGDEPAEMGDALPEVDLGTDRTALAVAAGAYFNCALLDTGAVKCWGNNNNGTLGLGLANGDHRGDEPAEMGDALPEVDLGVGRTATAVALGNSHACALLDSGALKCWGENRDGGLGLGDTESRGDEPDEMGDALPEVDLGTGRSGVAIAAGGYHTCALLDNGALKCWGANDSSQLGLGDVESRGVLPGQMGDALPGVDLGTGRTAIGLTASFLHNCAQLDTGSVKCWGYNELGELGLGDTETRGDEPDEMGDALLPVILVGALDDPACAG